MIKKSTTEQAWTLYFLSEGMVRENIAAVMMHIVNGNKALKATLFELAQAELGKAKQVLGNSLMLMGMLSYSFCR